MKQEISGDCDKMCLDDVIISNSISQNRSEFTPSSLSRLLSSLPSACRFSRRLAPKGWPSDSGRDGRGAGRCQFRLARLARLVLQSGQETQPFEDFEFVSLIPRHLLETDIMRLPGKALASIEYGRWISTVHLSTRLAGRRQRNSLELALLSKHLGLRLSWWLVSSTLCIRHLLSAPFAIA